MKLKIESLIKIPINQQSKNKKKLIKKFKILLIKINNKIKLKIASFQNNKNKLKIMKINITRANYKMTLIFKNQRLNL